jgi:hypothetical protein
VLRTMPAIRRQAANTTALRLPSHHHGRRGRTFICAHMRPNLVGNPNMKASACRGGKKAAGPL